MCVCVCGGLIVTMETNRGEPRQHATKISDQFQWQNVIIIWWHYIIHRNYIQIGQFWTSPCTTGCALFAARCRVSIMEVWGVSVSFNKCKHWSFLNLTQVVFICNNHYLSVTSGHATVATCGFFVESKNFTLTHNGTGLEYRLWMNCSRLTLLSIYRVAC